MLHIKLLDKTMKQYYDTHFKKYKSDSGFDLFCQQNILIKPKQIEQIKLGLSVQIIDRISGYMIVGRSSSIYKHDIIMCPPISIIDFAYTGPLYVYVKNIGESDIIINRGDSYWQIILPSLGPINFKYVEEFEKRDRGSNGFGSTTKLNNLSKL